MKITLITLGSRGDVQPYIPLALGFQRAGYHITLATHEIFRDFVESHGIPFTSVAGNPQELMQGEGGIKWLETGYNPVAMLRQMRAVVSSQIQAMAADCIRATEGADAVLYSLLGFMAGPSLMEKYNIPGMGVYLQPIQPTHEFPASIIPRVPGWLPAKDFFRRRSYDAIFMLGDAFFNGLINEVRVQQLGLKPYRQTFRGAVQQPYPVTHGYSPTVIPRPDDWPAHVHTAGYWFLDEDFTPPAGLVDWLAAGEAPVYIGFGSMTSRDPEQTTDIVLDAIQRTGKRCVLLSGWAGIGNRDLPDDIFTLDSIPHHWLFPQMAAIVHHGGAGTTGSALRSGKPSIIVPHFADQPFWAQRVYELGVSPQPIPRKQLSAERLAAAIQTATTDSAMQRRAADVGAQIEREDGVGEAVRFFERYVLQHPTPPL